MEKLTSKKVVYSRSGKKKKRCSFTVLKIPPDPVTFPNLGALLQTDPKNVFDTFLKIYLFFYAQFEMQLKR